MSQSVKHTSGLLATIGSGFVLTLLILCGCATAPKQIVQPSVELMPTIPTVHLTWTESYTQTNEQTVIIESPILTIPKSLWVIAFQGSTNQCWLPMIYNESFFAAYNELTN